MTTSLEIALRLLAQAESEFETSEARDGNAFYRSLSERHYREAAIYAEVAQAEALEKIARAINIYLNDNDEESNEAVGRTSEDIGY